MESRTEEKRRKSGLNIDYKNDIVAYYLTLINKVCPQQLDFIYNNLDIKTIENILDINNQIDSYASQQLYKDLDKQNKNLPNEILSTDEQIEANNIAQKYSTEIPKHILEKLK